MPNSSTKPNAILATFAPWMLNTPDSKDSETTSGATSPWGPQFESQARLWGQLIDAQRTFWSFYLPLFQAAPIFINGATKTIAEDEVGLEPAETVDGIPDAFELQMRTWNHFLDANRSFWSALNWPGVGGQIGARARAETGVGNAETRAPRKRARAKR